MKPKTLSTNLSDLYGVNNYHEHINVGDELWTNSGTIEEITKRHWNKIKVTYVRSGVMFFEIIDFDAPEMSFYLKSFIVSVMKKALIDPHKEFPDRADIDNYRFDDTFTEVINFDNSEDKEVNDSLSIFY